MAADILEISNELAYRAYVMNRDQVRKRLSEISFREYIALQMISRIASDGSDRAYLKDLADNMWLSTRQMSKLAGSLRDSGLVTWSHDGDGSDGTYLSITERGKELISKNEELLRKYYENVIEEYGREEIIDLLLKMKKLETIMQSEADDLQGEESEDEFSE